MSPSLINRSQSGMPRVGSVSLGPAGLTATVARLIGLSDWYSCTFLLLSPCFSPLFYLNFFFFFFFFFFSQRVEFARHWPWKQRNTGENKASWHQNKNKIHIESPSPPFFFSFFSLAGQNSTENQHPMNTKQRKNKETKNLAKNEKWQLEEQTHSLPTCCLSDFVETMG